MHLSWFRFMLIPLRMVSFSSPPAPWVLIPTAALHQDQHWSCCIIYWIKDLAGKSFCFVLMGLNFSHMKFWSSCWCYTLKEGHRVGLSLLMSVWYLNWLWNSIFSFEKLFLGQNTKEGEVYSLKDDLYKENGIGLPLCTILYDHSNL